MKDPKKLEEYVHKQVFPRVSEFERNYLTKYFTVLFQDGFDDGTFDAWSESYGAISIVTTPIHHGGYAAKATGSGSKWIETLPAAYTDLYARMYVLFPAMLSAGTYASFLELKDEAWTEVDTPAAFVFESGGAMYFGFTSPTTKDEGYFAIPIQLNTWYCIEIRRKVGSGNGIAQMWIDGNLVFNRTAEIITGNNRPVQSGNIYTTHADFVLFGDCYAVGDTYIGPEAVVPPPPKPCFIATAAYGSPLAPQLHTLRRFRDKYLSDKIVNGYYRVSPPIANAIAKHDTLKAFVRVILKPIVQLLQK